MKPCSDPKCTKQHELADQRASFKWEKFAIIDRLLGIRKIEKASHKNRDLHKLISKIREEM